VPALKRLVNSIRRLLDAPALLRLRSRRARPYAQFTFAALGRIAKASGVVQPRHIGHATQLMHSLGFGANDRRQAIVWFDAGRSPEFDFAPLADACRETAEARDVLNAMSLESLCQMAWLNGPPNQTCQHELERLAGLLGAQAFDIATTAARVIDFQLRQLPGELRRAYALLGIDHWVDDAVLKLAYRRMISRHHPDKLGSATDVDRARNAGENSVAIRAAFDLIQASRNVA
jgi:DnaJ like chaperone protein